MAHLPKSNFSLFGFDFLNEFSKIKQTQFLKNGLFIENSGNISFDNAQGLLSIKQTGSGNQITLENVENGVLYIDAPGADVSITLKSLHDSSFIRCRNIKICV